MRVFLPSFHIPNEIKIELRSGHPNKPQYATSQSIYSSIFRGVFFVSKSLWELRDKRNLKSLQYCPESLGAMLEY